jgi:hypothetical protein
MDTSHHTIAGGSKTFLSHDCCKFSGPQSRSGSNNGPPSQNGAMLYLSEIWGNHKISFFLKASLPHGSSHYYTKLTHWFKAYGGNGLIPWLDLPVCHQGCLTYVVVVALALTLNPRGS